jgi:CarD family transcriptional regulator
MRVIKKKKTKAKSAASKAAHKKVGMKKTVAVKKPAVKPAAKKQVHVKAVKPAAHKAHKPVQPVKAHVAHAKPAAVAARPAAVKPVAQAAKPAPVARPVAAAQPQPVAAKPPPPVAAPPVARKLLFKPGELVVYPAHGVGKIVQVEEQEIAGARLELYIVDFEKEKLRLRVPTNKADVRGMRKLADKGLIEQAMKVLRGRARIKRTMWSRRAQEYEAKINSGDLISVAEVVRDLYRSERQPEQSYSERQLFEQALERMAREIAAVKKIDDDMAVKELEAYLEKNAHRVAKPEAEELAVVAA